MKIIITALMSIAPDQRLILLEDLNPHIRKVRKQTGCIRYDWAAESCNPGEINVLEEWADANAVDRHFAGENFANIVGLIGKYDIIDMSAKKYGISHEGPVFNAEGKPSSDF